MDNQDRDMEIIALLSNPDENYSYVNCDREIIEHHCEKGSKDRKIKLIEVEYFHEAGIKTDKANFCDQCNTVFIYRSE